MSEPASTKPYLLRALYEWCTDNGYTPYIAVKVQAGVRVPMEFVRNGEIVLNIAFSATSSLQMDNDAISFKARFGGVSRDLYVPIGAVAAIYAKENGHGMGFDVQTTSESAPATGEEASPDQSPVTLASSTPETQHDDPEPEPPGPRKKPSLTVIK